MLKIKTIQKICFSLEILILQIMGFHLSLIFIGKPATTINLSIGRKRLSFDSQLRFDLDE